MTKPRIVTVDDLYDALAHYTCTERYHYQPCVPWMQYTDGLKAMAELVGAYWLLVDVALLITVPTHDFLLWRLDVVNGCATLTARPDSHQAPIITRHYDFTDFPSGTFEWYQCGNVHLLKSEY